MRRRLPRVSEARQAIRTAVEEHPGIHFRGLARAAHVSSAGQLRHHLDKLERDGDVVEIEDGRYRRFFLATQHEPQVRAEMARFARVVPRRIAKLLLATPMNRTQLRRNLRCADSTLGYHLSRMVMLGDLARLRGPQSCVYSLTREDNVRRMLRAQGEDDLAMAGPPGFDDGATQAAGPPAPPASDALPPPMASWEPGADGELEVPHSRHPRDAFPAQGSDAMQERRERRPERPVPGQDQHVHPTGDDGP